MRGAATVEDAQSTGDVPSAGDTLNAPAQSAAGIASSEVPSGGADGTADTQVPGDAGIGSSEVPGGGAAGTVNMQVPSAAGIASSEVPLGVAVASSGVPGGAGNVKHYAVETMPPSNFFLNRASRFRFRL